MHFNHLILFYLSTSTACSHALRAQILLIEKSFLPNLPFRYLDNLLILFIWKVYGAMVPQSDYQDSHSTKIVGNSRQVGSLGFIHLLLTFFSYFYSRITFLLALTGILNIMMLYFRPNTNLFNPRHILHKSSSQFLLFHQCDSYN